MREPSGQEQKTDVVAREKPGRDDHAGTIARSFSTKRQVAAITGEQTLFKMVPELDVHPSHIKRRNRQFPKDAIGEAENQFWPFCVVGSHPEMSHL